MEYSERELLLLKAIKEGGERLNLEYYILSFMPADLCYVRKKFVPTFEELRELFASLMYNSLVAFRNQRVSVTRAGEAILYGKKATKIQGDADVPFAEEDYLAAMENITELQKVENLKVQELLRKLRPSFWNSVLAVLLCILSLASIVGMILLLCLVPSLREDKAWASFTVAFGLSFYSIFGVISNNIAKSSCSLKLYRTLRILNYPTAFAAELLQSM